MNATPYQPLKDLYRDELQVAPFTVLADPLRVKTIFLDNNFLLSEKVIYILKKQLEESDAILLNKVDNLTKEERTELLETLKNIFHKDIIEFSAKTGEGLQNVINFIETTKDCGKNITEIDYDVYAEGEALLGWLNANVSIISEQHFDVNNLLLSFINGMWSSLKKANVEPAHLKASIKTPNGLGVVNLVSNIDTPTLSSPVTDTIKSGNLIINARVEGDPKILDRKIQDCINAISKYLKLELKIITIDSFRPARPIPVHRYYKPVFVD